MSTRHSSKHFKSGMSLVELLVAIGLVTLVFGGLMGSFSFMIGLIGTSKAEAGALALAGEKMEYIRSLPYADAGTISGIPNGPIPQTSTTTLNGVTYHERVLIEYVDATADGQGALDENGILADYKRVKVEYNWEFRGEPKTISLISSIVPRGIETTSGGGTLIVNVFDASVQPVAGAAVRLYNNTGTTTIDTTRNTNVNGVAMFSGAPAQSNYEITVTKADHSTDQTYMATTSNPNPVTLPVAVLEAEVSTMNFQIDELSELTVVTQGEPTLGSFEDAFIDSSKISSASDTAVSGDEVMLAGAPGSFSANGSVFSQSVSPGAINSWGAATFAARTPADTAVTLRVYDSTGSTTPTLIADTDLPGNIMGFAPGSINLSGLDPATYQSIMLGVVLETSDSATTSALLEWDLTYVVSAPVLSSIPFTLTSSKVIGQTAAAEPIYKYEGAFATDGTGDVTVDDLEWDVYAVTVTDASYDIAEACEDIPFVLDAGSSETLKLTLVPAVTHSLRVRVNDTLGNAIPQAEVTLSRSGYNETETSSACGQVFFNGGLSSATDYVLDVEATGYVDQNIIDMEVSGSNTLTVVMTSI